MKPIIAISTGLIYKFYNDRNEMIKVLKNFNPDGIELSFFDSNLLFDFEISKENIEYLKTLKHVSIHAPWKNIIYADTEHCLSVMDRIEKLAKQINAKVIVVEREQIEDFSVFDKYDLPFAIENDDWRKNTDAKSVEDIEKILREHPKFGFVFDIAHAMTVGGINYIEEFITRCGSRIVQIHTSFQDHSKMDHTFLHENSKDEIKKAIKSMITINKPLVLEAVALSKDEINDIEKEINYLKTL